MQLYYTFAACPFEWMSSPNECTVKFDGLIVGTKHIEKVLRIKEETWKQNRKQDTIKYSVNIILVKKEN